MRKSGRLLILLGTCFTFCQAQSGTITSAAGTQSFYRNLNGPALSAPLGFTQGMYADGNGNVYIADAGNNVVVAIGASGQMILIAGTGTAGFSGDNGPATQAQLNSPHGLAMDVPNNILYIADTNNSRIRKLNTLTGVISTAAGNGTGGFSGDGGTATSAMLNNPLAIAINSQGALFIADSGNACIRRLLNGTITTVAGIGGSPGFSGDGGAATSAKLQTGIRGVFADIVGNIYFSDTNNQRVRAFQVGNTIQTYIGTGVKGFSGDNGPPASAQLANPAGLTMDSTNTFLLIADAGNARIRSATNSTITTIAGNGTVGFSGDGGSAVSATFNSPIAVVVDPKNDIYIADQANERVREMRMGGTIATVAGNGNFEFFGDSGQATSALLGFPSAVAFDSQGSFFFTEKDNHRVRKVTSGGIISTIAGNGLPGYSGDGGQATSASLNGPLGIAVDSTGAVFFSDTGNNVVRKVTTSGTISTVAGNGQNTFSGDGGQATSASLSQPKGIAVDSGGFLLIADSGNSRVRMVTPQGVISTVAGNGGSSFSGDGSATAVAVPLPYSVAWFAPGNFYVADFSNRVRKVASGALTTFAGNGQTQSGAGSGDGGQATSVPFAANSLFVDGTGNVLACAAFQVRKITPAGILSTLAGSGGGGITGDGGPALSANMQCEGVALDAQGNIFIADGTNNRVRKVTATAAPVLTVTPASLTFTAVQGTNPAPQQLSISGPAGASWQAVVPTTTPAGYVTVSPASGQTPGTLSVQVITDSLPSAGTYLSTISIGSVSVNVSVIITAAPTGQLSVPSASYSDTGTAGNTKDLSGAIVIFATGNKPIPWTASADPASSAWLRLNNTSGTSTPGVAFSGLLALTLNAQSLAPGVFTSTITINPGGIVVPVKFLVSADAPIMMLSQSGLQFSTVQGSASVPAQSVAVVNRGTTAVNWTADTVGGFLSVSPSSGTSLAGQTAPTIQVRVNPANLPAGPVYGFVRVLAPGASGSPSYISVVLNILAPNAKASNVTPLGLVFVSATSPVSQTLSLSTAASSATATVTVSAGTPFSVSPATANLAPTGSVTVTATPGPLSPGVYPGTATVVFNDGSLSQDVKLLLVIPGTSEASPQSVSPQSVSPQATCTPKQLALVMRQLGSNFSSPVGWPVSLEAQVVDDCGNFPNNATVVATFSNGDAPLALVNIGSGVYTGTWKPASANSTNVTIRALLSPLAPATTVLSGQVNVNPAPPPAVGSGGVVNAASFSNTGGVSPGSIISVFGSNLATGGNNQNGGFPLPTTLGGIRLTMGGKDMPLFFSNGGQVNAQVPSDLQPASQAQVLARYFSGSTEIDAVPEPVTVGVVQPGIFLTNTGVSTQGVVLNNPQLQVVDGTHPAAAGDVLTIYCTGLGVTTPVVATGAPAPSNPPATVSGVTATIGGVNAPVQFAGLTPGLVGLYQVNVQVPPGVAPGASVKLTLLQSGVSSNTVTMGVK